MKKSAIDLYNEHFKTELDTWALAGVVDGNELMARCLRAIEENKPIDMKGEYGVEPAPDDLLT